MPTEDPDRLPRAVEPDRYELTLAPDLPGASFAGEERVRVRVHEPVAEVVLNAVELAIQRAELVAEDGTSLAATVRHDDEAERAVITLEGTARPGVHTLHLAFSGTLNDELRGFYRSRFTDEHGTAHTIGTTQFEPTHARRAFPCWDEPDRKATFAVTLVVDDALTAISNSEIVERADVGDGRHQVRFAETMPMSTYLVAFIVGPFEVSDPLDVDGVPVRVACVPGKQDLAGFALEVAAHALRFFSRYFEIGYPAGKLDLIALPDFAMGAMENLGAVTFRETALLVDPARATRGELERVADVIAHEIAHMWFGDLVTMKWWNGIWLNEAFATFMELLCVDDFRPEWERWVSFALDRGHAMVVDGLASTRPVEFPVRRPEDAEAMFDVLTYQKGAAVLRMLERYVGAEPFRKGIARYIATHSYGNTETTDLWDAVEAATGEPARSIMDSWIYRGGYPIVSVELSADGTRLTLVQRRFRYLEGGDDTEASPWQLPVLVRAGVGDEVVRRRFLVGEETATFELSGKADWVVANEGNWGFYRVRYPPALLDALTADLARLEPLERHGLVSDAWAAVLAGLAPVEDFVGLAGLLGDESDPNVWRAVLAGLGFLDRMLAGDLAPPGGRSRLQAFVRALAGPAFERLGWAPSPGEAETTRTLRATLIGALGVLGADAGVRARAAELHAQYLEDAGSVDADVAGAVVAVVAAAGGEAEYATFLERYRTASTPQEELRYLHALAGFEDPALVRRTMDLARAEARPQNGPFLVSALLANLAGGEVAWELVKQHWAELLARFPESLHDRMLGGVTNLSRPETAADVHAFLAAHPLEGKEKAVEQLLERLDIAVAFRARHGDGLADVLPADG
ncbi:MAG: M1 family metallopeptidase [Actinomycetota bacterium]|nr:M1 family metallopeptidase [Actinomycetota bacterium]